MQNTSYFLAFLYTDCLFFAQIQTTKKKKSQTINYNHSTKYLIQLMRLQYFSHRRPAKAQASLRISTVSPEPSLFAHMQNGCRQTIWPKIRHLPPTGWLRMRVWRMSLRRTNSTIISWNKMAHFDYYQKRKAIVTCLCFHKSLGGSIMHRALCQGSLFQRHGSTLSVNLFSNFWYIYVGPLFMHWIQKFHPNFPFSIFSTRVPLKFVVARIRVGGSSGCTFTCTVTLFLRISLPQRCFVFFSHNQGI